MSDQLVNSRHEYKFVLSEYVANAIRDYVAAYLLPDPHMPTEHRLGYLVHSVYLDSPSFHMYRESVDGIKNRHKLRIRYYSDAPEAPAFLEIKSRITTTICKQRAMVTKCGALRLLEGLPMAADELCTANPINVAAFEHFCARKEWMQAQPTVVVNYRREAYVSSAAESTRITFDRNVAGCPFDPQRGFCGGNDLVPAEREAVILELKYSDTPPVWVWELFREFGLCRVSYPKYVRCLDAVQEQRETRALPLEYTR